jgi:hypothetical protein
MYKLNLFLLVLNIAFVTGCKKTENASPSTQVNFTFQTDNEGWVGDFADYPNENNVDIFYALDFLHSSLPAPLNTTDGALKQSGNNHSDDLFMFVKKKIAGLSPNKNYSVSIEIQLASDAPENVGGIGGGPSESVYIKAGASTIEPVKVLQGSDNYYRINIDKGNQSQGGVNMKSIGNFSNGTGLAVYKLKTLTTPSPVNVTSNANGEIWLIIGTDSGFEGPTTIYYNSIKATIK